MEVIRTMGNRSVYDVELAAMIRVPTSDAPFVFKGRIAFLSM
ncbi:hypothetical protein [Marinomonas balearica]|nr:hypothetical protein [Marinomonas balearica]